MKIEPLHTETNPLHQCPKCRRLVGGAPSPRHTKIYTHSILLAWLYIICPACVCDGTAQVTLGSFMLYIQPFLLFLSARCNNGPALTQSTAPQMPVIAKFNLIVNYARRNECLSGSILNIIYKYISF